MSEGEPSGHIVLGDPKNRWESGFRELSAKLKPRIDRFTEGRIGTFNISVINGENLDLLKENPHVIVANHPVPEDKISNIIGISPDTFVLSKIIKDRTGKPVHFLGQYGLGAAPFLKYFPDAVRERWKQAHRGLMSGHETLSYDSSPGAIPRQFVEDTKKVLAAGDSIVIYPYGERWHTDEELAQRVQRGPAYISRKFDVPILPMYVEGAKTWRKGESATVIIGDPFTTQNMTDEEAMRRYQQDILALKPQST